MTDLEEQQLREMSADLAGVTQSPWQPRCIARVFATPVTSDVWRLTMQGWIDLDADESPLLVGKPLETIDQLEAALRAFGRSGTLELTPEETAAMSVKMQTAVREAFAMALKMAPPEGSASTETEGFGEWQPLLSCLIVQAQLSLPDALNLPVGQAFALIAAMRFNQGWKVAGVPYAMRDISDCEEITEPC